MSAGQARDLKDKGHEIASHTVNHPRLRSLTANELHYELKKSKDDLANLFQDSITSFASPFGEYNPQILESIKKYYSSHRTVNDGFNAKNTFNIHEIRVQNITPTTTTNEVTNWVSKAKQDKTWLVLVYHQIDNGGDTYSVTPVNFESQLIAVKQSRIYTATINQALAEIIPQVAELQ